MIQIGLRESIAIDVTRRVTRVVIKPFDSCNDANSKAPTEVQQLSMVPRQRSCIMTSASLAICARPAAIFLGAYILLRLSRMPGTLPCMFRVEAPSNGRQYLILQVPCLSSQCAYI